MHVKRILASGPKNPLAWKAMRSPAAAKPRRLDPEPPAPLTEQAYRCIKAEILSNRLPPGAPLVPERFVREMKLSRTPVREAILRLEREGFVEIRPRLGTFVSHLDLRKIREMYFVRAVLEGSAARLAAAVLDPAVLARVERELKSQRLTGEIDLAAISNAGQSLHAMIVDGCGNQVLSDTIRGLQDHFSRFRHLSLKIADKVLSSHREHIAILHALKRRDGDLAEALMRDHFDHAARFLLESIVNQPSTGGPVRLALSVRT